MPEGKDGCGMDTAMAALLAGVAVLAGAGLAAARWLTV